MKYLVTNLLYLEIWSFISKITKLKPFFYYHLYIIYNLHYISSYKHIITKSENNLNFLSNIHMYFYAPLLKNRLPHSKMGLNVHAVHRMRYFLQDKSKLHFIIIWIRLYNISYV